MGLTMTMGRKILVLLAMVASVGAIVVGQPNLTSAQGAALAPVDCEFTVAGSTAEVSWTRAPNDEAVSFVIRRSRDGGAFGWTGRVSVPATTFTQTVPASPTYAYTVEARDTT